MNAIAFTREVRALCAPRRTRRKLILRGSPKRVAPTAKTAKPLRRDDGRIALISKNCIFDFEYVARIALRHSEILAASRSPFMAV
jgi:hypothetical protein